MRLIIATALSAVLVAGVASESHAAVLYSTIASTYTQNFDSLPNTPTDTNLQVAATPKKWIDDTASPTANQISIEGWYLYYLIDTSAGEGGTNGHQRMRIGTGSANTGAFMSFGSSASTDRALGSVAANTLSLAGDPEYMGLRLTNTTGVPLTQITISYDGEQYRDGGAAVPNAQSLTFAYKVTSGGTPAIQDAGFTAEPLLNFSSPVFTNTGSGGVVAGNTTGKVSIAPVTIWTNWGPGEELWIRWTDLNDAGNDHGLAIDNLNFSADVPEPSSLMLLIAAVVGLALAKRR